MTPQRRGNKPPPPRRWRRLIRHLGAAAIGSVFLVGPGHRALGQSVSSATVTEILDSNQVYIQNRTARVNSVAQQRQQVRTQAARTSLRFNTGAIGRLTHNSSLVIGQCAQLSRGTLLVNGAVNGCSTSTLSGVRGTLYTLSVDGEGRTTIQVFEGEVVVQRHDAVEPVDPSPEADLLNPLSDPAVPVTDPVLPFVNPPGPGEPVPPPNSLPGVAPSAPTGPLGPAPTGPLGPEPTGPPGPEPTGPLGPEPAFPSPPAGPTDPFGPELDIGGEGPASMVAPSLLTALKQDEETTTVEFTAADSIAVAEGQQVIIDPAAEEAVIAPLTPEDFIQLLEGPLVRGFAIELPGIGNLRDAFERLFPGVPLPSFWVPAIPSPSLRFPFPF